MKKIRITLQSDGTQNIEVLGAEGDECLEFTRALEERLGKSEARKLKEEFENVIPEAEVIDGEEVVE